MQVTLQFKPIQQFLVFVLQLIRLKLESMMALLLELITIVKYPTPHYTRLQSAAHADYSGNVEVTLPVTSGDIIVGNSTSSIDNNINTTGIITAGTFSGSGASLTSIPAGQLSGSLPAIDGSALTGINASVPANLTQRH